VPWLETISVSASSLHHAACLISLFDLPLVQHNREGTHPTTIGPHLTGRSHTILPPPRLPHGLCFFGHPADNRLALTTIMPSRATRPSRPAMFNTPHIRNGGFGALQVEAIANRPLSIARRHLAASQLRMGDIEPDELSSSEWVRFLVMQDTERERWMSEYRRRRRNSNESTASSSSGGDGAESSRDAQTAYDKAEEARQEAEEASREESPPATADRGFRTGGRSAAAPTGSTPLVSLWARRFSEDEGNQYTARRPRHARRAVTDAAPEAPPAYETVVRARTPPPAYEPRSDDEGPLSPLSTLSP